MEPWFLFWVEVWLWRVTEESWEECSSSISSSKSKFWIRFSAIILFRLSNVSSFSATSLQSNKAFFGHPVAQVLSELEDRFREPGAFLLPSPGPAFFWSPSCGLSAVVQYFLRCPRLNRRRHCPLQYLASLTVDLDCPCFYQLSWQVLKTAISPSKSMSICSIRGVLVQISWSLFWLVHEWAGTLVQQFYS